ncbi:hydrogenase large subunit [Acetobacteraceae bacterium]|nr:hydrogenase large subunit [Acetobacteraceae bacterium]
MNIRKGQTHVDRLREDFPSAILGVEWQTETQLTVDVKVNALPDVVESLYYKQGGWLPVLFGNDERTLCGNYAIYYVISFEDDDPCWLTVRTEVDPVSLEFPSVTMKVPAAVWGERELRDMYGLVPVGLPDERRLVLPDDWPDGLYPLRKDAMDYRQRPAPVSDQETYEFRSTASEKSNIVPIGPYHITSDEPGHFRLFVDGENIVDADYRLFYVHRGMEKLAETRMGYNEVSMLADRVCGICGMTHSVGYCTAVENAMGLPVPERAQMIRTILLEVERLHSNLLNVGLACHNVGFHVGFMKVFTIREHAMKMAVILTGGRKTYCMNLIGGVRRDILKEERLETIRLIRLMRKELNDILDIIMSTSNIEQRTKGIGILDKQVARDYSNVGPMMRGSGWARDVRVNHDVLSYRKLPVEIMVEDGCDVYARVKVRIREVLNSFDQIEFGLDNMPNGDILLEGFTYKPHKFALGYTEAPRGENVHWAMTGDNQKLFRWRCRAATYSNWPTLRYMLRGNTVADAPLIVASLDPCYSCTDRMTIVDVRKNSSVTVPYKEIERYAIDRKNKPF